MKLWFHILVSRLKNACDHSAGYYLPYAFYIGLIGIVGFPLYFIIWSYVFPQPYETLTLRLIGCVLFLGLALIPIWPNQLRRFKSLYWLIIMTFALPFFFVYMLLMNQGNTAWAMSTMGGLALLIMVAYDWALFAFMLTTGTTLAIAAFSLSSDHSILSEHYLSQLSVYLFLITTGSVTFYYPNRIKEEKLKVLRSVGAEICHELRTPLMTIQNNTSGLHKHFPVLTQSYELAKSNNLIKKPIRPDIFKALEHAIEHIENEVKHSNTIIDMLLMNLNKTQIDTTQFEVLLASEVMINAKERYPFDSEAESSAINIKVVQDFEFVGSEILMTHVIFNLIKNALVFTKSSSEASIDICLKQSKSNSLISFRDNGEGISLHDRLSIFDSFYSSGKQHIGGGSGIGLAFCKKVMLSFGGDIKCHSEVGKYTEFILSLPRKRLE
jgi:Signal transduction histidine kinase